MFALYALSFFGCSTVAGPDVPDDSLITFNGGRIDCIEGSTCDPIWIFGLPFFQENDLERGSNAIIGYDCIDGEWGGNELVYGFNLQEPGDIRVELTAEAGVNAFLVARDQQYTCTGQGAEFATPAAPGRYWLVVDSTAAADATDFTVNIAFDHIDDNLIADEYEPNDTPADAPSFDVGIEETWEIDANLTPASRVDYFRVDLAPIAEFALSFEDPNVELELVEWSGLEDGPSFYSDPDTGRSGIEYWDWSGEYETDGHLLLKFRAKDGFEIPAEGYEYSFEMYHDHTA